MRAYYMPFGPYSEERDIDFDRFFFLLISNACLLLLSLFCGLVLLLILRALY